MALDLEKPGSDSRSSSPSQRSHAHTNLKFSIERILSSEFGKREKPGDKSTFSVARESTNESTKTSENSDFGNKNLMLQCEKSGKLREPILPENMLMSMPWLFASRTSCRPSSGPRTRRLKSKSARSSDCKRPRTAFSESQLSRLRQEFESNRYLTENRRKNLSHTLQLNESQVKIWFQNKRAKMKKSLKRSPLALQLMAKGLYNHSTISVREDEEPKS